MNALSLFPSRSAERDQWILDHRPARNEVDPRRPYAFLVEEEPTHAGELAQVATVFLTNRECPWRCVMCDLWKNTLSGPTPLGAIPEQIQFALSRTPPARQIKLYNSGSFFDRQAIPPEDYGSIASLVKQHERVIVESHPSLIGDAVLEFRDLLSGQLEVAMGLETVHRAALEKLNKRLTTQQFAAAAQRLIEANIDLRVFILVQPPFVCADEALFWAQRSVDFAFECGATAVTLIPTRAGNGGMEQLERIGEFTPPKLSVLEAAFAHGLRAKRGRVFVDLWEIADLPGCLHCREERLDRLRRANLSQVLSCAPHCSDCGNLS